TTTVLIVEDEFNIGRLVHTYLERDGYGVVWVRSGEEGLVELERHAVDLIVLDVGLPGIDGFEVCRRVRASSSVPVIMLTARDEETDRVVGLELGADDYVPKPFSPRELGARVKAVLRRPRSDDEGFRPARLLSRASRLGPHARTAPRARLGPRVPGRHAHRRPARGPVARQARRFADYRDPAWHRLQAGAAVSGLARSADAAVSSAQDVAAAPAPAPGP